jgi:glycosyltransferase involved in cell wall biosynthesis
MENIAVRTGIYLEVSKAAGDAVITSGMVKMYDYTENGINMSAAPNPVTRGSKERISDAGERFFIVIPALNPDERLITLIQELKSVNEALRFIVIDDGSTEGKAVFDVLYNLADVTVLTHSGNLGKGRALKTAAAYLIEHYPDAGMITADADGQHTAADILRVLYGADLHPDMLTLGVRNFHSNAVPRRSKIGNKLSAGVFKLLTGRELNDTQTGLRGIPVSYMDMLQNVDGDRYEFEMNTLFECVAAGIAFNLIEITTVYEAGNKSNFHTVRDAKRIYSDMVRYAKRFKTLKKLGGVLKFGSSSIISAATDIGLCMIFSLFLPVIAAVYASRAISGAVNFTLNRNIVFRSHSNVGISLFYYICLFLVLMFITAHVTDLLYLAGVPLLLAKIMSDAALFCISYFVQKRLIFRAAARRERRY